MHGDNDVCVCVCARVCRSTSCAADQAGGYWPLPKQVGRHSSGQGQAPGPALEPLGWWTGPSPLPASLAVQACCLGHPAVPPLPPLLHTPAPVPPRTGVLRTLTSALRLCLPPGTPCAPPRGLHCRTRAHLLCAIPLTVRAHVSDHTCALPSSTSRPPCPTGLLHRPCLPHTLSPCLLALCPAAPAFLTHAACV